VEATRYVEIPGWTECYQYHRVHWISLERGNRLEFRRMSACRPVSSHMQFREKGQNRWPRFTERPATPRSGVDETDGASQPIGGDPPDLSKTTLRP